MSDDKLIRMANQIATFMQSKGESEAIAGLAAHINDFWAPQMRGQLLEKLQSAVEVHPLVIKSADLIHRP